MASDDYTDEQFEKDTAKATSAAGEFEDGVYGAEGDDYKYEVRGGEILIHTPDGKVVPAKGRATWVKAIQGQLRDGTLQKGAGAAASAPQLAEEGSASQADQPAQQDQDKYEDMSMQDAVNSAADKAHRQMVEREYALQTGMPPKGVLKRRQEWAPDVYEED